MNHCVKCGFELDDAATACGNCGWGMEAGAGGVLRKRSDGSSMIGFGWCGIAFGILFTIIGMFPGGGGTYDGAYGIPPPTYHLGWVVIGGGLFNLGLLLLLAGFIIRAIWFLPGPDRKLIPGTGARRRPEGPSLSPLTRPGSEGAQV